MYLVALSGGADSVCLLLTLLAQGKVGAAAHCNFHLRGAESDRDEAFVRHLCAEKQVRLFVTDFDTQAEAARTGESIEMVARRLRYEWFAQLIASENLEGVAVGHHQEDNAETLLLNLIRGTGMQGLQGMQRVSYKQGFCIYRPLLNYTKSDILSYLQSQHQGYVTDSTNADTHYKRNKIRHEVLPLLQSMNPQVVAALNQMAQHLTEANDIYQLGLQQLYAQCELEPVPHHRHYKQLLRKALAKQPHSTAILRELTAPYCFTPTQIADALKMRTGGLVVNEKGLITTTPTHYIVGPLPTIMKKQVVSMPTLCSHHRLVINADWGLEVSLMPIERLKSWRCEKNELNIDVDAIKGPLVLRSIQQADRFRPFGMKGTKLVSDYLTNQHGSRLDKLTACVLADAQGILWLVGHRADDRTRLSAQTQQVLHLKMINYQ